MHARPLPDLVASRVAWPEHWGVNNLSHRFGRDSFQTRSST